eukprot:gene31993-biopygen13805
MRRNTPYDGKGGYDIFVTWYADLVAPLLEKCSVFSVVDGDLDYEPIDEPSNGYHYPRDSRITPPPSSPSDDGDSTAPPTPTSDGEPSDLRAFEDAAAAADLLRGAIPMLNAWGINYEVDDPVPPEPRPENPLQGPVQTVEAMVITQPHALASLPTLPVDHPRSQFLSPSHRHPRQQISKISFKVS